MMVTQFFSSGGFESLMAGAMANLDEQVIIIINYHDNYHGNYHDNYHGKYHGNSLGRSHSRGDGKSGQLVITIE